MSYHLTRLGLYWAFFKSTLIVNLVVSIAATLVAAGNMTIFTVCLMTVGPLFSFFYKEVWRPNEYFFYHNRGISKYQLMTFAMAVNILLGTSILIIIFHVASS
jgi:hypothetical protein